MKLFESIAGKSVKYSRFDLSHERKLSMKMGYLYPILCSEIVPGDKFKVNTEVLMRLAPMLAPVMTRLNIFIHYFFVPNRLLWQDWERFITGGPTGADIPIPPFFYPNQNKISAGYFSAGSLSDYLGSWIAALPVQQIKISALPYLAYQEIWKEYYMDRNLTDESLWTFNKNGYEHSDSDADKEMILRKRCWEKDYFTSALPWPQRGTDEAVISGEVSLKDDALMKSFGVTYSGAVNVDATGKLKVAGNEGNQYQVDNIEGVVTKINDLRKAVRLQEWLERSARGGSRYIEAIMAHFGVRSSDARLQRPEYLGGQKIPVTISEVLQTYQQDADETGIGSMYGHGIGIGNANGFNKAFEEHGFLMGIMSTLPRTAYQQGIPRMFSRVNKFDYYWPEFANLGEQEILKKEIFFDPLTSVNEETWGYQSRYAEYKYNPSSVHGDFRNTLIHWHQSRVFSDPPPLNQAFVESDPTTRIFNVTDESIDHLWCQLYNRIDAVRPMPYFGTPIL